MIFITKSDAFIADLYNNNDAMGNLRFMSRQDTGGWSVEDAYKRRLSLEQIHSNGTGLNCIVKIGDSQCFAGVAGFRDLHWWNRSAEMGIILHPNYWSKGLATEIHFICLQWAFEEAKLHRIEFKTSVSNAGMNHLCKNVMFCTLEGTLRDYFPHSDYSDVRAKDTTNLESEAINFSYESVNLYSILDDEWPQAKQSLLKRMQNNKNSD